MSVTLFPVPVDSLSVSVTAIAKVYGRCELKNNHFRELAWSVGNKRCCNECCKSYRASTGEGYTLPTRRKTPDLKRRLRELNFPPSIPPAATRSRAVYAILNIPMNQKEIRETLALCGQPIEASPLGVILTRLFSPEREHHPLARKRVALGGGEWEYVYVWAENAHLLESLKA